ncbi:hypothetical protein [Aridibaculum aurantiacum]|uniref:hypothetical protein n=1 Tax=Aridibaculum aurantiacum TaxID=2810307 RepID=UPI001A973B95|nr:hypothetical protein [Aridibaculum aurantiacum]
MKRSFYKYVKGIFCSFLRISGNDDSYYLVTYNYLGGIRNCRIKKDAIGSWEIENDATENSPYQFTSELIGTIERNETYNCFDS